MNLYSVDGYLLPAAKAMLGDENNWSGEQSSTCKICLSAISGDLENFCVFKMVDGSPLLVNFHYGCALLPGYADAFQTADVDGWVVAIVEDETVEPGSVKPVMLRPTGETSGNLLIRSRRLVATLNADTIFDISFGEVMRMQGISAEVHNASDGDWARFALVHPDTQQELALFGDGGENGDEGVYMPPSGVISVVSDGAEEIQPGLLIRITYHSEAISGDQPIVYLSLRLWR